MHRMHIEDASYVPIDCDGILKEKFFLIENRKKKLEEILRFACMLL